MPEDGSWKRYADQLNDEFGGRTIQQCHLLNGRQFAVTPGALKACGSATHAGGTPVICDYDGPNVDSESFWNGIARVVRANQSEGGPCVGCAHLVETKTTPRPFPGDYLSAVSLHDFSGCNSRCVYCAGSEYFLPVDFKASQDHETLFGNLIDRGLVKRDVTAVSWGGGEPTLVDTFDRTVNLLGSNHIPEVINTSGIRFSPAAEYALKNGTAIVRVSVDSGTNETYLRVKRNPGADAVWESIRRYAATGGNLIVKYIIFSENSDSEEVRAFVDRCSASGVRRICISVDVRSIWGKATGEALTDKELMAAASMYNMAKAKGMNPYFEEIWTRDHLEKIASLGGFDLDAPAPKASLVVRGMRKIKRMVLDTRR